jgi:multidrug efflux system outer membrane protein
MRARVAPVLAFALVLPLAGCMLGPDYTRPAIDTPAAWRVEPKATAPTADVAWWKAFGDPQLDGLVAEALVHNQNLAIATANVDQAAGLLTQTRSALFPQIGYTANGQRERTPLNALTAKIPDYPNPQTSYQALLTASWEIDLWGRIRRLSEAARADLLATDAARNGVILTVVASVTQSYVTLRGLDEQLAVAQRTLGTYSESVKLFGLQFKYGQTSQMTVAQAQSQYETAAAQIPQIETQIAQTENALSVLVGRNPGSITRGKSIEQLTAPAVPPSMPSELLEQRPDLVQAEQQLIAANAQIGAAKALYFPTISLTGAFGGTSAQLSDLFKGPARAWSYAGQFVGPIFTFGAVSGQVNQAEAQQQAALANYRLTVQNAFADVDNALVANQNVLAQLAAQTRLVAALGDYARLARLQYTGGYVPYSTVLQAEQSLFPAELQLAAVRASMLVAAIDVYKATAGGWIAVADQATGARSDPATGPTRVPPF